MKPVITTLDGLDFDNRFVRSLPADPEPGNFRRQVFGACFSKVLPTPTSQPQLVAYAQEVADLLDLPAELCTSDDFAQVFSGNRLAKGMEPYALCYGGHQFGHWAGQLGDGRAINLGEVRNRRGDYWTLQLKGAGPTPYSRSADGLAVLRSSVREFLCSEAMHHLGIPTTRALSLVLTGDEVIRDMFYNGNPQVEPGAVVCRVAPSFTRFGSLEIFARRGELALLKQLADYTLRTDFPHLGEPSPDVYLQLLAEICRRTAELIVHWQRVGFVHGVMNTDNMSVLGLTIDYGPYGWLDNFALDWTPNTTDAAERRYRYGNQPNIAYWNLAQLANAFLWLLDPQLPATGAVSRTVLDEVQAVLAVYKQSYTQNWQAMMAAKLGWLAFTATGDYGLCTELLALLQQVETDMTGFFRCLAQVDAGCGENESAAMALFAQVYYRPEQLTGEYRTRFCAWLRQYGQRLQVDGLPKEQRRQQMDAVNPKYVLRNYLAQLAIDQASQGDFALVNELLDVLRQPYAEQPGREQFAAKRPDWARTKPGCSMLSCSS